MNKKKITLKFDTVEEYREWKAKAIPHVAMCDVTIQRIWVRFQNG